MHASAAQAGVMPKAMQLQMQQRLRVSAGRSTTLPLRLVRYRMPASICWASVDIRMNNDGGSRAASVPCAACWAVVGWVSRPCCVACSCISLSKSQAAHTSAVCMLVLDPKKDRLLHATMPVARLMQLTKPYAA